MVILNPSKEEWVPLGMDVITWRAISWPLLGILFWWSAGRGIEALIATRRGLVQPEISWVKAAIGGGVVFVLRDRRDLSASLLEQQSRRALPVETVVLRFGDVGIVRRSDGRSETRAVANP